MLLSLVLLWSPLALSQPTGPVDLSHPYDSNTRYWPGDKHFDFTKVVVEKGKRDDFFCAYNEFETAEHGGTHLDAPYHFYGDGWKVGDIPVERFMGQAVYVDLRAKAEQDHDYEAAPEDFEQWEELHGAMPDNAIVLLDFGWTRKYRKEKDYFGSLDLQNSSSYHFPGLSEAGAQWLVDTGKVYGVGTDAASINRGQSYRFQAHRTLARNNLFTLEHVAYPKEGLEPKGYQILALPMKIKQGTAAPCRVLAVPLPEANCSST